MKKLLLIILFFVSWAAAKAQDKIITITKDTIECRIVSVNADRINYEQKTPGNLYAGKSISTAEVLQYFRTEKPGSEGDRFYYEKVRRQRPEHSWLFSLQGGLAHSFTDYSKLKNSFLNNGNSASAVNDYFGKLQNGYHLNASLHYLLSAFFGIGVDYNFFHAASKGELLYRRYGYSSMNAPIYVNAGLDEKLYSHFTGASVLFQQFFDQKRKIKISETLSPGLVQLRKENRNNEYQVYWGDRDFYSGEPPQYYQQANFITTGSACGAKGSLAIDYALTPQLSAGIAGDYMWAKLKKVSVKNSVNETKDTKLESSLNLSHLDYGFIVRYNF